MLTRRTGRNGHYHRHFLTLLGDIELCVPAMRLYSPVEVLRACARREAEIDGVILAGFVRGSPTRKVGKTLRAIRGRQVQHPNGEPGRQNARYFGRRLSLRTAQEPVHGADARRRRASA